MARWLLRFRLVVMPNFAQSAAALAVILGVSGIVFGCEESLEDLCVEECEVRSECSSAGCDECTALAQRIQGRGCEGEGREWLICGRDVGCDTTREDECTDAWDAYFGCMTDFCDDHPDSEWCAD
ncbi:MAG: hypothetical protein HOW73_49445 [Polyangiaceae bacterium]|nr:hypothetical protein [Polyangiaceae bacterium]